MTSEISAESRRTTAVVVVVTALGLAVRTLVALTSDPMAGDPLFSYTYRATLIASGDGDGVFLMWHPPGYPLLLGALSAAIAPAKAYWVGVGISLASYLGLAATADALLRRHVRRQLSRVTAAGFIAFYETFVVWSVAPLTEPPYLFLCLLAVLLADRDRVSVARAAAIGAVLGVAFTIRLEGIAPAVGLLAAVTWSEWRRGGLAAAAAIASSSAVGFAAAAGWLLFQVDYLSACRSAQEFSYTFPKVHGLVANGVRAVQCAYYAVTRWLPFTLLLPYWLLVGAGLGAGRGPGRLRLHLLLGAVVVPSLLLVGSTIMHKRTGMFLLPAAAVWLTLGFEVVLRRFGIDRLRRAPAVAVAVFTMANAAQLGRIDYRTAKEGYERSSTVAAAATIDSAGVPEGKIWAFGGEPEIYAILGWAQKYPFWDRERQYNRPHDRHGGDSSAFAEALREANFRYLVFAFSSSDSSQSSGSSPDVEEQTYGDLSGQPKRELLRQLLARPTAFGVQLVGAAPCERAERTVYVFALSN